MAGVAAAGALVTCAFLARRYFTQSWICHFCGRDGRHYLPSLALATGSWYCPHDDCGQYNGFGPGGDYDRPLPELSDPAYSSRFSHCRAGPFLSAPPILCSQCQCEQGLLIRAVAHAETLSEASAISRRYRLCSSCREAVARRLQTVQRRIRVATTPLQISELMPPTKTSPMGAVAAALGLLMLLEIVILLPPIADIHRPEITNLIAVIARHDIILVVVKLMTSAISRRRSMTLLAIVDLTLRLSRKGRLQSYIVSLLGNQRASVALVYEDIFALALRCINLFVLIFEYFQARKHPNIVKDRCDRQPSSVFESGALPLPVHSRNQLNDTTPSKLVSGSAFQLSLDRIGDDFVAMEGAQSCAVEDMFAGISISRSHPIPSSADRREAPPASSLPIVTAFAAVAILFVAHVRWSSPICQGLYTASLLVLLGVGRHRHPIAVPFTLILLLRQWNPAHYIWGRIYAFLMEFGPDLAALMVLGLTLLVDWSGLMAKLNARNRTAPLASISEG